MAAFTTPYETVDAAALAGFKKILLNSSDWKSYEYGFLVIEQSRPIVRQIGHEGFMDTAMRYPYTEPHTDHSKSSFEQTIPPQFARMARALCHPGSTS
jgi:hypothetical protein